MLQKLAENSSQGTFFDVDVSYTCRICKPLGYGPTVPRKNYGLPQHS